MTALVIIGVWLSLAAAGSDTSTAADASTAATGCEAAEAMVHAGEAAEARKLYVAALEQNPTSACAEQGLAKLNAPQSTSFKQRVEDILNWLPDIAGMLGVVAIVAILALAIAGRVVKAPRFWMRFFRTRLIMESLDDQAVGEMKIGATMTARIRERLQSFREETESNGGVSYSLDFDSGDQRVAEIVSGDDQLGATLDKLGETSSQLKLVAAMINLLIMMLPIKRLKFSGVVEPNTSTAARTTLSLQDGSRLAATATLAGPKLEGEPKADDYLTLCEAAAVWVQYAVASQSSERVDANDAESYALVREGLVLCRSGNTVQGMDRYERAFVLNPRNWAARANLAITKAREFGAYVEAAAILDDAIAGLQGTR